MKSAAEDHAPESALASAIRTLHPAYFGLVMATGIVSIAAYLEGMATVAGVLLWMNTAAFVVLVGLNAPRAIVSARVLQRLLRF